MQLRKLTAIKHLDMIALQQLLKSNVEVRAEIPQFCLRTWEEEKVPENWLSGLVVQDLKEGESCTL